MVTLRPNPYEYRRRLPHHQKSDRPMFVTFRTLTRDSLPPSARTLILEHCLHDHGTKMTLHVAVIMPEHVHMLLTPLRDAAGWPIPLSKILQAIKGASAYRVNRLSGRTGPLWQDESFDHVLRSDESFADKVEYIRQNPVRRGLARIPEDYPWLWQAPCGAHTPVRGR